MIFLILIFGMISRFSQILVMPKPYSRAIWQNHIAEPYGSRGRGLACAWRKDTFFIFFTPEKWHWKNGAWSPKKRASRISRWSKINDLNMNINIPGSKISNIIQKRPKISKNILNSFFQKNLNFEICFVLHDFLYFHICVF